MRAREIPFDSIERGMTIQRLQYPFTSFKVVGVEVDHLIVVQAGVGTTEQTSILTREHVEKEKYGNITMGGSR